METRVGVAGGLTAEEGVWDAMEEVLVCQCGGTRRPCSVHFKMVTLCYLNLISKKITTHLLKQIFSICVPCRVPFKT